MPVPALPLRLICYADDITITGSGQSHEQVTSLINDYTAILSHYLTTNNLIISEAKSTASIFTLDNKQFAIEPNVIINNKILATTRTPKILGVTLDTQLNFGQHCDTIANACIKRNNILKLLSSSQWGPSKETLLATYKTYIRPKINYCAEVYSITAKPTHVEKLQRAQNASLRAITGAHASTHIPHLHHETKILSVQQHNNLLSKQFWAKSLATDHPCHELFREVVPVRPHPPKDTIKSKFEAPVEAIRRKLPPDKQDTHSLLTAIHTDTVKHSIKELYSCHKSRKINSVLMSIPPDISKTEERLTQTQRRRLCQLRSGTCSILTNFKRSDQNTEGICPNCGQSPDDVRHLFACPANPTTLTVTSLWNEPARAIAHVETTRQL